MAASTSMGPPPPVDRAPTTCRSCRECAVLASHVLRIPGGRRPCTGAHARSLRCYCCCCCCCRCCCCCYLRAPLFTFKRWRPRPAVARRIDVQRLARASMPQRRLDSASPFTPLRRRAVACNRAGSPMVRVQLHELDREMHIHVRQSDPQTGHVYKTLKIL
eukprot:358009-Chlamydomonas_euryale.AAC.10